MTREEFYSKWCPLLDTVAEREHMLLLEAGFYRAEIIAYVPPCGHEHWKIAWDYPDPPDELSQLVQRTAMPVEMYNDSVSLNLHEIVDLPPEVIVGTVRR